MKNLSVATCSLCVSFFMALGLFSCNNNGQSSDNNQQSSDNNQQSSDEGGFATATINSTMPDTAVNGTARFTANGNKVKMNLQLTIPSKANKTVAVHIHENGSCSDSGKAAGGHWNPTNAMHGDWGGHSFHAGDIGNINVDASGNVDMELETDLWSLDEGKQKSILNKSVIVHNGVDDYKSQPSGNSGVRIGCGIIAMTNK